MACVSFQQFPVFFGVIMVLETEHGRGSGRQAVVTEGGFLLSGCS